ncbi:MAG: protein-glutamate O-methyltransferase CheR [Peptococcaceae bacterium]|jgi:chemotaxis protein methyltransferase CheR|nr:protein-glutamate O-methyltransferase CheR [Peptococcaceae bacterium]MDH7525247.1 protein-glutamate O-methyltransferase CheR [Peptococcaceae bacterium]
MDEYERFLVDLKKNLDIDLTGYKRPQMERRINSLMRALNIEDYVSFIKRMKNEKEVLERFVDHLTINVSEFFRNISQWQVLEKQILPSLLIQSPNLRVWSAGCSTGEEPYTLAMLLSEAAPAGQHTILATDFDQRALNKAIEGFYPAKAVTGLPAAYLKKYFRVQDNGYLVVDTLKRMVTFKCHNLLRDSFPKQLDLIVCRNVVIYFTEESKTLLYNKLHSALRRGGILFTGSTEQIIQAREIGFQPVAIFFYKKV